MTVTRAEGVDRYKSRKQSERVIDEAYLMRHIRRVIAVKIKADPPPPPYASRALARDNSKKRLASRDRGVTIHRHRQFLPHYVAGAAERGRE